MATTRIPYRRSYRPSVEECERQILWAWCDLCNEVRVPRTRSIERVLATRLHDYAVLRERAIRREARA